MKSMINVGNEITKGEAAGPLGDAICRILETAGEQRTDREVTIAALNVLKEVGGVSGITFHNCNLTNNPQPERQEPDTGLRFGDEEEN